MLFNSYIFIFAFLPVAIIGFYWLGLRFSHKVAIAWLAIASLTFYAWWNPPYLFLLLFSIGFNYSLAHWLSQFDKEAGIFKKTLLIIGITINLLLLGYFKYANFFVDNMNTLTGSDYHLNHIVLPLAISFFTFQQIAFLVDVFRGQVKYPSFINYSLFVAFFPQLIAGPIVHHNEMMPQFASKDKFNNIKENILVGAALFAIGLFKKVIIADGMGEIADPMFNSVSQYGAVGSTHAWWALLAYTFQIYFDFSAYSDMAIGLGRMFGVNLPLNFNSPYKSANIFEFWNRWHMTFARFMRNHVYIPIVRNRKIKVSHQLGLIFSVLLGGLWHGANWTFIVWGGFHAVFMLCNHYWHALRRRLGHDLSQRKRLGIAFGVLITFFVGMFSRIFFRAESFEDGATITKAMLGMQQKSNLYLASSDDMITTYHIISFVLLFIIVWFLPNSQQWVSNYKVGIDPYGRTRRYNAKLWFVKDKTWPLFALTPAWAVIISLLLTVSIMNISHTQVFIYFQF